MSSLPSSCSLSLQKAASPLFFVFQGLKIQDLQQERLNLHRDIYTMAKQLGIRVENLKNYEIADRVPLFPVKPYSKLYPGDTEILGKWLYLPRISRP